MPRAKVRKKGKLARIMPPIRATHIDETAGVVTFDRAISRKELNFMRKKIESFIKKKGRK